MLFSVLLPLPALMSIPSPTVGGRKKYNREHLLSLRFLKECMEPPEGLFLPGTIGLVRKTGPDAPGPMGGVGPRDLRDDRHSGGRDKRVCGQRVCACAYSCWCGRACARTRLPAYTSTCMYIHVCAGMHCVVPVLTTNQLRYSLSAEPLPWRRCYNAKD